jgi:hypothetical protein
LKGRSVVVIAVVVGVAIAGLAAWHFFGPGGGTPPCNGHVTITLQSNGAGNAHPDPCRASRDDIIQFHITNNGGPRHASIDDSQNPFLYGACKSPVPIGQSQNVTVECQVLRTASDSPPGYHYEVVEMAGVRGADPEIEVQGGPGGDDDFRLHGSSPAPRVRVSPAP